MNPFYFGSSDAPLFGVHHPPIGAVHRDTAAVLCYPMGQEYMRAHRAFRQLALLLSRAGFPVLRFDYFGSGDSAGDSADATVDRWIADIHTAVDEIKEIAAVDQVALIGLRFGGALAAYAADRDDVSHLVLWDTVVSGKAYLEEVMRHSSSGSRDAASPVLDVMGFALSGELQKGIAGLDLTSLKARSDLETLVVVSVESEDQRNLAQSFQSSVRSSTFTCIPSDGSWDEVDDFGSVLIPQAIIRSIVLHLSEAVRA